jgi:transmembrane sensor
VREYLRAEAVYAALARVDAEKRIDVDALLATDAGNVVELGQARLAQHGEDGVSGLSGSSGAENLATGERATRGALRHAARSPRLWASAASVVLAIAAAAALYLHSTAPEVYATARGEQRRLVLEDGSVVDMNTETELSVRIDDDGRYVALLKGEALFTVAKDPGRPFVVDGELARVRALGTEFNVHRQPEQMRVTVIEGRVSVEQDSARRTPVASGEVAMFDPLPVVLAAGDQAQVGVREPIRKTAANTEKALAWRERRLIFENQPLSDVVAEFNRYNRRQLVIEHAELSQTRISAVFDADQPEALVRFLTQNTPIQVIETSDSQLVLRVDP